MRTQLIGRDNEPHWSFAVIHLPFLGLPAASSSSRRDLPCLEVGGAWGGGGARLASRLALLHLGLHADPRRVGPGLDAVAFHSNLMIMIFAEDDLCLHSVITLPCFL